MEKLNCTLLVDDDETTNFMNELLFQELDLTNQLLIAHNGQEALELIQRCVMGEDTNRLYPQLILLDINMPVMNGFEFLKAFEQVDFPKKSSVIVVMLTSSLHPSDIAKAKGSFVAGFLNKPLKAEDLIEIVNKHFK